MRDECQTLARAVVAQAWADAFDPQEWQGVTVDGSRESYLWLIESRGARADSRADWCSIAGVCPDLLRRKACARAEDHREAVARLTAQVSGRRQRAKRRRAYWRDWKRQSRTVPEAA